MLRAAIDAHGGFMFKHTRDGVCAAFSSPSSAVNAAVTAQLALELPVRMGLATGEAELRDGDYFGTVLNRAARGEYDSFYDSFFDGEQHGPTADKKVERSTRPI